MKDSSPSTPGLPALRKLIDHGPMPLAQLAQRARNSKSAEAVFQNARCLGEAAAALGAAFRLGTARRTSGSLPPRLREALAALVRKGSSFGTWVGLLREGAGASGGDALSRLLQPLDDLQPIENLAAALEPLLAPDGPLGSDAAGLRDGLRRARGEGVLGFLDFLVNLRNRVHGHGAVPPEALCRAVGRPLLAAAAHVAAQDALLDGHWLGRTGVSVLGEESGRHWKRLAGLDAEFLEPSDSGLPPADDADPRFLHFVRGSEVVSAAFLVAQEEDTTGLSRFGFFQRLGRGRKGGVDYVDYIGAPFRSDETTAAAQEALADAAGSEGEAEGATSPEAADERRFGDYVIEGELGRGAMGIVYRARQISLGRVVALKVLPPTLLGDPVAMGRFHREGMVLARCDHPNVVRVLAYGIEQGRPWYAMEQVDGSDLSQVFATLSGWKGSGELSAGHISEASASRGGRSRAADPASGEPPGPEGGASRPQPAAPPALAARGGSIYRAWARLFAQAAEGISEIHGRGVIHRDVKPENLMLTADGERLVVMDLGLAKTAEQSRALTAHAGDAFVGTARYAAPEQIQARLVPMDFRADVYALGATLHEMVALAPMYDSTSVEDLLRRKLVEQRDPPSPREVDRRVPADLDTIVRKATAREPGERYASAADLAKDLQAFADDRPIAARPPSRSYHLKMFYRRNRALVHAGLGAFLALAAVGTWGFLAVRAQRDRAVAAEKTADVNRGRAEDLADFMLGDLRDRLAPLGKLDVLEAVARRALEYYQTAGARDPGSAAKRGAAFRTIGDVLRAQGDLAGALEAYRAAHDADEAAHPGGSVQVALDHERLGDVARAQGDADAALEAYGRAREMLRSLADRAGGDPVAIRRELATCENLRGDLLAEQGRSAEALEAYSAARAIRGELAERDPSDREAQRELAQTEARVGDALRATGDVVAAVAAYRSAVAIMERLVALDAVNTAWQRDRSAVLGRLGHALRLENDLAGALQAYRTSGEILRQLTAGDPTNGGWQHDLAVAEANVGEVLRGQGDSAGALDALRRALDVRERLAALDPSNTAWQRSLSTGRMAVADVLRSRGEWDEARRLYDLALAARERLAVGDPGNSTNDAGIAAAHVGLGETCRLVGDTDGALEHYRRALEIRRGLAERDPSNTGWQEGTASARNRIGMILLARGDVAGARGAFEDARATMEALLARNPDNTPWQTHLAAARQGLGAVLVAEGRPTDALQAYETACATREQFAAQDPDNTVWLFERARCALGRSAARSAAGDAPGAGTDGHAALAGFEDLTARDPSNAEWRMLRDEARACLAAPAPAPPEP